jgi:hypothetical protein
LIAATIARPQSKIRNRKSQIVNYKSFDQLLHLDVNCHVASAGDGALLILGDGADALAAQMRESGKAQVSRIMPRVLLGLPILTAPFPLFVGGLMTERNTVLEQLSVFAWIEDHYIDQPRAEVFGLTPFAEQPVMFLRDFDMDRPIEAWFQTPQPARWLMIAGVAIATAQHSGPPQLLRGDAASLLALEHALPADALPFLHTLRDEVDAGQPLKTVLRQRRKAAEPSLMRVFDGWRVLPQAARFIRVNPAPGHDNHMEDALRLSQPKRW